MDNLDTLLGQINDEIMESLPLSKVDYFREAHLQTQGDRGFPIANQGSGKGVKISPDSKRGLQTYHRVIETEVETDPERGYGKYPYRIKIYRLRSVWIGHRNYLPKKSFELNDGLENEVILNFPTVLTPGKQMIKITGSNTDKLSIFAEEFEGIDLARLSLDIFAFTIDYEMRARIRCI